MDTIKAIRERRAINFFNREKDIPVEKLNEIISIANFSPSSFNLQPWEVVVVNDSERKKILRECANNQPKVEEAPAVLIIIANPNAVEENLDDVLDNMIELGYMLKDDRENRRGAPFRQYKDKDSETRRIFAVKNTSFFAMNFMIAARGLGFETHPMDGFDAESIKKEFNIPQDRLIPLLIAVGYPRDGLKLLPPKFRRELNRFVKYNNFV